MAMERCRSAVDLPLAIALAGGTVARGRGWILAIRPAAVTTSTVLAGLALDDCCQYLSLFDP